MNIHPLLSRRLARAAFALLLAASATTSLVRPALAKDDLTIGITQYPVTLHPSIESMLAKTYVLDMTRRPFTAYDKDWQLVCMLCVTLPTIENGLAKIESLPGGKKGIAVTYTIQPKATWGDGVPLTTKDVLFSYEVGKHPQSGVTSGEMYRRILKIDVKDDKTFTMHMDRVTFDYNAINDFNVLPEHLERARFADPAAYRSRNGYDTDTTNPGLYFGPYKIVEKAVGSHIVLEPNPTWWGKPPYFKRIVVRAIENTSALEANLLSGSVDYIAGELGLTLDQAIPFEKRHAGQYNILYKPSLTYEHIDLNLDNPILQDKRVRQALILGIDREAISKQLFDGRQAVASSMVNPLDWVYDPATPSYARDPAKAAALLDAAGWTLKAKGGIRANAKGEPLMLEFMTTAANKTREQVQQVLQSQWRQLGIDVRIRNEPARVFFGETMTKRRYGALAMYAWYSAPESVPRTTLHSSQIPTAENNFAGQNYPGFSDPAVDALLDSIESELDRAKRKALWSKLQAAYADDLPVIPLFFRADPYIFPKWLKDIEPTGHQDISTLWVENWSAQ
ncbi:MAG TPA: peptide ABC transporter substrate-binding protein [Alphaproteobacteria bacterium]|jgi:peptide/nickel transport system substrate-binding protein